MQTLQSVGGIPGVSGNRERRSPAPRVPGCSTYIRRYLISHFNEPVDIASSNFTEETAVFGGGANLKLAVSNIIKQYQPALIGVGTTCLSETIGDDVPLILREYILKNHDPEGPAVVSVSTPSYSGTHIDGFHGAIRATVDALAKKENPDAGGINLFPGMLSPADYRHYKEILSDFGARYQMLPDYSQTLDGPMWTEYQKIPAGGTPIKEIVAMGDASGSIELGRVLAKTKSAGKLLADKFAIPCHSIGLPIGIKETDLFFDRISAITGKPMPEKYVQERSRLIDAYADGHKYVFEARAVVYGEEDLVIGMASFLSEIGVVPALCASGGKSGHLKAMLRDVIDDFDAKGITVMEGVDFVEIGEAAKKAHADFFIGNSKGYKIAREMKKPLIRIGFPIHDRMGGARIVHIGYRGAQQLFDCITNTIIQCRQDASPIGYTYM
ncbi:nitrogenase component 1 [Desulfosarcina cetonica]|uniref:nitrogenase component 1 n=1 Tax=Desulfosarcina cetonica TaxID=90730 RepID=UPI001FEF9BC7|nr:nitrogenase component 1 [Desulfosarcina cetonica]